MLPTNSVNRSVRQAVAGFSSQQRRAQFGRGSLGGVGGILIAVGAWLTFVLTNNDPEWEIGIVLMATGVPVTIYGIVHYRRERAVTRATIARIEAEQQLPVVGNFTRRSSPPPPGSSPGHAARRLRARCPNARLRRRWPGHTR